MNIKKGAVSSNRNTLASYRKHYIPLESNPVLFTQLIRQLGVSPSLAFQDVLSINDPDLLAFIPRPALALILVFPTSDAYEVAKAKEEEMRDEYDGGSGKEDGEEEEEPVMWFRQSINNACGLYAILHAISNGEARNHILPNSHLSTLLTSCSPLKPLDRALALEADTKLESIYTSVALQGDSTVPTSAEAEVDFHYVCFVKSHKNNHLYEMDGDRKGGPVDLGGGGSGDLKDDEDVLDEAGLSFVRKFIEREGGGNMNFSLLVLAPV